MFHANRHSHVIPGVGTLKLRKLRNRTRHGEPQDEWAELAETGHRAVDHPAGEEIDEGVPEANHQEHRADHRCGQAGDIGEVGDRNAVPIEKARSMAKSPRP